MAKPVAAAVAIAAGAMTFAASTAFASTDHQEAIIGSGKNAIIGSGKSAIIGSGKNAIIGSGKSAIIGSGKNDFGSAEYAEAIIGSGKHAIIGSGKHAIIGSGKHAIIGSGKHAIIGSGKHAIIGSGKHAIIGSGKSAIIGSGKAASYDAVFGVVVAGPLEAIDPEASTMTIVGQTVQITKATLVGGDFRIGEELAVTGVAGDASIYASTISSTGRQYIAGASEVFAAGYVSQLRKDLGRLRVGQTWVDVTSVGSIESIELGQYVELTGTQPVAQGILLAESLD